MYPLAASAGVTSGGPRDGNAAPPKGSGGLGSRRRGRASGAKGQLPCRSTGTGGRRTRLHRRPPAEVTCRPLPVSLRSSRRPAARLAAVAEDAPNGVVTVAEAAAALGMNRRVLSRKLHSGALPTAGWAKVPGGRTRLVGVEAMRNEAQSRGPCRPPRFSAGFSTRPPPAPPQPRGAGAHSLEELPDVDAEGLGPGELVGSNPRERGLDHGVASLFHG